MVNLYPSKEFRYPIIAECINPETFQGKTIREIEMLKVWEGNKQRKLGELFKVEMTNHTQNITIQGDLGKVRKIGVNMKSGEITIHGNVGMHLGEEMQGGKITVYGNVGGWAGSMMKDGIIEIHGNASDYLGAPYRGCSEGMRGGKIIVHGNVGNEAGAYMRGGIIKIYGSAGQFAGFRMCEGTIFIQKDAEARVGACMKGGKIVVGERIESVLPSFTIESLREKVKVEEGETAIGPFYLFVGDLVEHGEGKLYISKNKNPHLSIYEKFL
jgi:formylmethanofuran dehydrogenase subunit C